MILDELAAHARERVAADKAKIPLEDMKAQAEALPKGDFRFEKALSGKECAFICEVKKASPSKGIIDPVFDFEAIAQSSHLVDCIFEGCDLSNLEFNKISIHRCCFVNCKMVGIGFIDCSIRDVLFQDIQGRYMNIALGNMRNVEFKDTCLDESSIMEVDMKQLEFNHVSLINSEVYKTSV